MSARLRLEPVLNRTVPIALREDESNYILVGDKEKLSDGQRTKLKIENIYLPTIFIGCITCVMIIIEQFSKFLVFPAVIL